MSISDLHPTPSPAVVLGDVVEMLRGLDGTWWTHQSDDDLVATVELVEQARSALAAVQAGAVEDSAVQVEPLPDPHRLKHDRQRAGGVERRGDRSAAQNRGATGAQIEHGDRQRNPALLERPSLEQ